MRAWCNQEGASIACMEKTCQASKGEGEECASMPRTQVERMCLSARGGNLQVRHARCMRAKRVVCVHAWTRVSGEHAYGVRWWRVCDVCAQCKEGRARDVRECAQRGKRAY